MRKFIIGIAPTKDHYEKLVEIKKKRVERGYPKIGTVLTAIKTGYTYPGPFDDGPVTKGKKYTVFDNGDLTSGYFHVTSDEDWFHVLLTPEVLKEFFGVDYHD